MYMKRALSSFLQKLSFHIPPSFFIGDGLFQSYSSQANRGFISWPFSSLSYNSLSPLSYLPYFAPKIEEKKKKRRRRRKKRNAILHHRIIFSHIFRSTIIWDTCTHEFMQQKYGTMRDNVINLKVVLANGDVVKTGARARKSAAGYDLTRLMIGSEGTLGVITEVTLRLQKIPKYSVAAMCNFPTVKEAADVAIATMMSGIQVSRVELLDEVQIKAINIANGKNLIERPTLMFEFIGTEAYSREQALIVQTIVSEHNGSDFVFEEDPEAKKELWKLRKEALWSCFAMKPNHEAMIVDACVPLSRLAETISRAKQTIDASPLDCPVIAHAGDGNFHALILFDPHQAEQRHEAERLNNIMVQTALSMEGTCTGEHGVGTGKMKYLEQELGIEALRTMKRIKTVLDPNNIMNPGKIIPPHVCI